MDAADDNKHHQSSSFIKQSNPKLIIKFAGRHIIQQQCSKEAEEVKKKNMSVSKHNLLISNSPKSISNNSDSSLCPTCSICGKSFPSKQSLFGHMRSHPEREWRGIQPPPPPPPPPSPLHQSLSVRVFIKNSPASTGSDDSRKSAESASYQGVGPLPVNWSATGKRRGRKPYGSFLSSDERIVDAVKGLLMLKEGNDLDVALMNKQISRETEGIITISKKKKKKRMILESSSDDVSRSSDLLRSSKKIKIDQERSCSSSRDGFLISNIQSSQLEPKLISNIQSSQLEQVSSDLLRSSKKIKIDQGRSCNSSRNGFDQKLISHIQSSQLEQLPAASNMFQQDCGLVKNDSKNLKLADERISCGSSREGFDPKNSIHSSHLEQLPFHGDFRLVKKSPKKVKLEERGCGSSRDEFGFDPKLINSIPSSHVEEQMPTSLLEQMYSNGFQEGFSLLKNSQKLKLDERNCSSTSRNGFDPKLINSIHSSSSVPPNGYFQGVFNSVFLKPAILMKATTNKKKVKEIERGSSADQDMGLHGSTNEFKCDTCNRTFPSHQALGGHKSSQRNCKNSSSYQQFPIHHDHQYLQCRESIQYISETKTTKTPMSTSYNIGTGTHQCELCGVTFGTGQALGGHKRRHYTGGGLNSSGTDPVNLTAMAQTEKLIKKEEMKSLSVGEEVISTTTTTKTENKPPVLDFDLNEMPDESWG